MITAVKLVSIPVKDQDRAKKFYTAILGFTLLCDVEFDQNQRWIELATPEGDVKISLFTPEEHASHVGTFSNVNFGSRDVHQTFKELSEKGVEFTVPPTEESWGIFAIFKDSEGNSFCLVTPNH